MKIRVTKRYVDRHTKEFVEPDTVIEPEDARASEIISQGFAEVLEADVEQEETEA